MHAPCLPGSIAICSLAKNYLQTHAVSHSTNFEVSTAVLSQRKQREGKKVEPFAPGSSSVEAPRLYDLHDDPSLTYICPSLRSFPTLIHVPRIHHSVGTVYNALVRVDLAACHIFRPFGILCITNRPMIITKLRRSSNRGSTWVIKARHVWLPEHSSAWGCSLSCQCQA